MLVGVEKFIERMKGYGAQTVEVKIYENADHVNYVKQMMKESLIRYYGK